jgi:hypothetical protein
MRCTGHRLRRDRGSAIAPLPNRGAAEASNLPVDKAKRIFRTEVLPVRSSASDMPTVGLMSRVRAVREKYEYVLSKRVCAGRVPTGRPRLRSLEYLRNAAFAGGGRAAGFDY